MGAGAPRGGARPPEPEARKGPFNARAALLFGALRFEESGAIDETIDRAAGRYEVRITGRGSDMTTEIESTGVLREGRWAPLRFTDRFLVYGRESRLEITYDYARRLVRYHGRSETFLLRRIRATDDTVAIPAGAHVDDVVSATLNYAEDRWPAETDGQAGHPGGATAASSRLSARTMRSGAIAPSWCPSSFAWRRSTSGRATALLDMTRFSSWAREDEPARIVFGADPRPESITASLILGTSLAIRFGPAPAASCSAASGAA